jgi:hypothetical protein
MIHKKAGRVDDSARTCDALVPGLDNLPAADLELERLAAIAGRVELDV